MLVLLALACTPRPDEICHPAAAIDGEFFARDTETAGLTDVRGNRITAADFDNDGWVDLLVGPVATMVMNDLPDKQYNYLLRNDRGVFVDVTEESGILFGRDLNPDRSWQGSIWGDVDNDGDLDLWTGYYKDPGNANWPGDMPEILLNDGAGQFQLAPESDVNMEGTVISASFLDANHDGNLDLWVVTWYERYGYSYDGEPDALLLGNGDGTFDDATEDVGIVEEDGDDDADIYATNTHAKPGYGATACDVNGDGFTDLLATNYGRSPNELWMSDGNGGYTQQGVASGYAYDEVTEVTENQYYLCYCEKYGGCPEGTPASAFSTETCDDYAEYWAVGWDTEPWRLGGNTFTTVCGDLDDDGDNDLYNTEIVHWHIGSSSDPSQILVNDGSGQFARPGIAATGLARERPPNWNEGDVHAAFLDVDNDGRKDILLGSTDYPDTRAWLYRQTGEPLVFEEVGVDGGLDHEFSSGMAVADFDNDGDQDLVLGVSTARGLAPEATVEFWRNDLGGNHANLRLVGTTANRGGVGAKITVEAGGRTQHFEVGGGYGHVGLQNTTDVWVGLGDACEIDLITVTWPDGERTVQEYNKVRANYTIVLSQAGDLEYVETP